jgi:hypothetical protein
MNLTSGTFCCFEAGHEHCGQIVSFADERLNFFNGDVSTFDSKTEPKVTFVGFFERDLKLRKKFGLRASPACSTIVSRNAGTASSQLRRDRASAWAHRHAICDAQALQRELSRAWEKFTHASWLADAEMMLNGFFGQFYVLSSNLYVYVMDNSR